MDKFSKITIAHRKIIITVFGVLLSGLFWYISNGLNGDYWYLLWLAPIPVLTIAFDRSAKQTFLFSFVAYFLGRLSWFSFLVSVATLIPALIFTIAIPLLFALIMLVVRVFYIKINTWYTVFAFPVFFTAFEWLLLRFSPDGSIASIAYSQSNFIALIQLVSLTGILGITFIVTFIPSVLAVSWHFRKDKSQLLFLAGVGSVVLVPVFLFGFIRIANADKTEKTIVGLVVLDEKAHKMDIVDGKYEIQHAKNYAFEIEKLAKSGAKVIVLPERAVNINVELNSAIIELLSKCAKQNRVSIVVGYANFKNNSQRNSALVINDNGNILLDYDKVHLVTGFEDKSISGSKLGLFAYKVAHAGTAICKDLDYPEYIYQYGQNKIDFLCIPAWDFVVDDWLHSRMAVLRGVENGFSEIRTARLGRLTISDYYGNVTAEANCSKGNAIKLIGQMSLNRLDTIYEKYGDWFGILIIVISLGFILLIVAKRKVQ